MSIPNFLHLGSKHISELVHGARERIIYCAPGLQQSVAAAIVNARNKIGRDSVRVILDVDDGTSRMGYGEFDAVTLLAEGDVDVRVEPGLRTCVVICDSIGYAFFTPPIGNVDSFVDNTFEASFVSTGTAPIVLTIELCSLNGMCYVSGFACASVPLTRGLGCSTGNLGDNEPLYAKFRVRPTGGGTVDGMGSLRVIALDGTNSAAVQTHGPVPDRAVIEQ